MPFEMIIEELTELAHAGALYVLIVTFGFLSIIIVNGIIRSGRKAKRDMNKT
jgi:hypothetical protein